MQKFCDWWRDKDFEPVAQQIISTRAQAVSDEPYCVAWKELARRFPRAKVVLTLRDSPEQWFRSFADMQQVNFWGSSPNLAFLPYWQQCDQFAHLWFHCDISEENVPESVKRECMSGYLQHMYAIQREIPPERLLLFNVKEGWAPLVRFLNVSTPNVPFPFADPFMIHQRKNVPLRRRAERALRRLLQRDGLSEVSAYLSAAAVSALSWAVMRQGDGPCGRRRSA
mmetsp:Transcript_55655/g.178574  ORF Transcript_55655/g.178574 Transcript_55655/m.178574 type:complete len:225 (+) Transcript_55655:188-862(+)